MLYSGQTYPQHPRPCVWTIFTVQLGHHPVVKYSQLLPSPHSGSRSHFAYSTLSPLRQGRSLFSVIGLSVTCLNSSGPVEQILPALSLQPSQNQAPWSALGKWSVISMITLDLKTIPTGAGEGLGGLRTSVVLAEDPGWVPNTHTAAHNSSFRGSNALFWPLWAHRHTCGTHTCRQNTHEHNIKINLKQSQYKGQIPHLKKKNNINKNNRNAKDSLTRLSPPSLICSLGSLLCVTHSERV